MNKKFAITKAVEFLYRRGYTANSDVMDAIKAVAGYDGIQTILRTTVFDVVESYMSGTGYAPGPRLSLSTALSRAYLETLDAAYQEGGGELPVDEDTAAWARGVIDAQFGFIDQLFEDMRQLRKGETDPTAFANARADGYASALDGFAVEAQMRGSKNIVLTWRLGETEKHCATCSELNGQRHKISWYIDRDYIPRKSGCSLECGGWNCDCSLVDRNGNEYSV